MSEAQSAVWASGQRDAAKGPFSRSLDRLGAPRQKPCKNEAGSINP